MNADRKEIEGPYIRWLDFGIEGWQPTSYKTIEDALAETHYGHAFVITRKVKLVEDKDAK